MSRTIRVDPEIYARLLRLKEQWHLGSLNAVLKKLQAERAARSS